MILAATSLSSWQYGDIGHPLHRLRDLAFERKDDSLTCDFTVPEMWLDAPKLCFAFTSGIETIKYEGKDEPFAGDFFFVRLSSFKDHLAP